MIPRFAIAITCLALTTGAARADELHAESATEPTTYVSSGVAAGVDKMIDWIYGEVGIDAAHRMSSNWWLHASFDSVARIGYGPADGRVMIVSPVLAWYTLRLGGEARSCSATGVACFLAGGDLAYRTGGDGHFGVVSRAGIDLGGTHLRARVEGSLMFNSCGGQEDCFFDAGLGLKLGAVYLW